MTKRTVESACGNCRLKGGLPFIAMLLGALILAASFLLPFGTARKEYREWLSAAPDRVYDEELNMTRRDAINLSLIELARAFGKAGNLDSSFSMGTIIAAAVFALLTLAERAKMKKLHIIDGGTAANFADAADESEKGE